MKPAKLTHTRPCRECPWKRSSPRGYLGGNSTEIYADAQRVADPIPCHMETDSYCAGSLINFKNSQTVPRDPALGKAVNAVKPSKDIFSHWTGFVLHHEDALETPLTPEEKSRYEKAANFFKV